MNHPIKLESHYQQEGDFYLVEIRLPAVRNLFNSLDPAPFREKDLDSSAERYIVESVKEFPAKSHLKLVFHLPEGLSNDIEAKAIPEAVRNYFEYSFHSASRNLRETLKLGRISLYIGLTFLFMCILARQGISSLHLGVAGDILEEGLLISGWVAMWRPIQIFLYDWWPIQRQKMVYRRIARLPIELR